MNKIVYSIEDDENLRSLINYTLQREGYEIQSFESAEECLEVLKDRQPHLILLDLMLPNMTGYDFLKIIRQDYSKSGIKVIILTAKSGEFNTVYGLNAGADDYITKPFSILELLARVEAHLRDNTAFNNNDILDCGGIKLQIQNREVLVDDKPIRFTYLEFELLKLLMKKSGTVVTREEILTEIWGYEYYGENRTIDIHIKNIRAKLDPYAENIVSVRGVGYIFKAGAK
ncbi:MAG: response regulator transcription factor [Christensenellaceae bacterium]|jgi:two-component system alkaline phosphatase synthesis response regulator PhoP|nr:response regulator transcription factor [Christensenellaceae bacterium]